MLLLALLAIFQISLKLVAYNAFAIYRNQEGKEDHPLIFKPGFVRITIPFHASEDEVNFTIEAVEFVAKSGWQLLPLYKMNVHEGTFRFQGRMNLV